MACGREQLIGKLKHHTKDFVTLWCLLRYCHKYGCSGIPVGPARGKWISLATELCGLTSFEGDAWHIKQTFLNENASNPEKVIAIIHPRFSGERITDIEQIRSIAIEFVTNIDEFIRIISSGSFADVAAHADTWFPLQNGKEVK